MSRLSPLFPAQALVLSLLASTGLSFPVEIAIRQETPPGASVFVSGPLVELGAGDVRQALKLSPHDYPVWSVTVDLPAGISFRPEFLLRADGPSDLGDPENATPLPSDLVVATPPADGPAITVRLHVPPGTGRVEWRRRNALDPSGDEHLTVLSAPEAAPDGLLFTCSVPAAEQTSAWTHRFLADGEEIPPGGGLRLGNGDLELRHGHVFRGTAPDAPATIPRRETFTWTPSDPAFKPRRVSVLLPRNYDREPARRYPVLYAQDGQNVFSPGGAFGSWDLDLIATDLIRRGEIPEVIILAIDNGEADRIAEYIPEWIGFNEAPTRGGRYLRLLVDEVMPEVDRRWRTMTGPEHTAHLGSSLGGVLGFEAANEHPDVFGAVVAMSPSFWLNRPGFLERARRPPSGRARLLIDSGTAGPINDAYPDTIAVRDALIASGHILGPGFHHSTGVGHAHNEAAWRARLPGALRWLYGPAKSHPPETGSGT